MTCWVIVALCLVAIGLQYVDNGHTRRYSVPNINNVIWIVVGILACIALAVWIAMNVSVG